VLLAALPVPAGAGTWRAAAPPAEPQEGTWEVVSRGAIVLRTRQRPGSPVREVWAETELAASAWDIQQTLLQPRRFPSFMPYVQEAWPVGGPDADGGQPVYTRLALPLVGARDYVVKTFCDERVASVEAQGSFRQRWLSVPDRVPPRPDVTRLTVNEGSWKVKPLGPERAHVVYRFLVHPGGFVPAFAADIANRTGVQGTIEAVEREAKRRAAERRAAGGKEPAAELQECRAPGAPAAPEAPAAGAPSGAPDAGTTPGAAGGASGAADAGAGGGADGGANVGAAGGADGGAGPERGTPADGGAPVDGGVRGGPGAPDAGGKAAGRGAGGVSGGTEAAGEAGMPDAGAPARPQRTSGVRRPDAGVAPR
jgi:hypothetical protein